jgi:hypothetical protein
MGRKAPWTVEEVAAIKRWQTTPFVHPLTCPNHGEQPLAVTSEAVSCPRCDWRQTWVPTAVTITRPEPDLIARLRDSLDPPGDEDRPDA